MSEEFLIKALCGLVLLGLGLAALAGAVLMWVVVISEVREKWMQWRKP
jgi:hypothetical protein